MKTVMIPAIHFRCVFPLQSVTPQPHGVKINIGKDVLYGENEQYNGDDVELHVVRQVPRPEHAELALGVEVVDVEGVAPPQLCAGDVVVNGRGEDGVVVGVFEHDLVDADGEEVGRCEAEEAVENEGEEFEGVGGHRFSLEVLASVGGLRRGPEVGDGDEQAAARQTKIIETWLFARRNRRRVT